MAKGKMDLSTFVGKLLEEQDGDVLREGIRVLSQALMESEVAGLIGADRYERTSDRQTYRNGYRLRTWDTRVGTIELAIPKLRAGSYFPSLLEPRRRAERALLAVVQEAYVHGVSTRKVDDLLRALWGSTGCRSPRCRGSVRSSTARSRRFGAAGSRASTRTCGSTRPTTRCARTGACRAWRRWWRSGWRRRASGRFSGVDAGPSEDRAFWTAFLRSLVKRGLRGVRLVISDAHEGLTRAVATVLSGATWQRCRVHFMRNLLATIPRSAREPVAAIVRTIFAQPDRATAQAQLRKVVEGLRGRFAQAAELLEHAAEDVLAYLHFPAAHRRQLHSTNPLERLNKEIKRRSAVVGIFPHRDSLLRLVGALLAEQDDEWAVADRRYFSAESMQQLTQPLVPTSQEELLAAIA